MTRITKRLDSLKKRHKSIASFKKAKDFTRRENGTD